MTSWRQYGRRAGRAAACSRSPRRQRPLHPLRLLMATATPSVERWKSALPELPFPWMRRRCSWSHKTRGESAPGVRSDWLPVSTVPRYRRRTAALPVGRGRTDPFPTDVDYFARASERSPLFLGTCFHALRQVWPIAPSSARRAGPLSPDLHFISVSVMEIFLFELTRGRNPHRGTVTVNLQHRRAEPMMTPEI